MVCGVGYTKSISAAAFVHWVCTGAQLNAALKPPVSRVLFGWRTNVCLDCNHHVSAAATKAEPRATAGLRHHAKLKHHTAVILAGTAVHTHAFWV
jgi:hypothetical protein